MERIHATHENAIKHRMEKTLLTHEEIFARKAQRRKTLAALPVAERVEIIERLHDFAVEMREWRAHRALESAFPFVKMEK